MSTEPATTIGASTTGHGPAAPTATTAPGGGFEPTIRTAMVTVAHRRASDIAEGDVMALPDEVLVPVPATKQGRLALFVSFGTRCR